MKRSGIILGLLSLLLLAPPADALRGVVVGNRTLGPQLGFGNDLLAAVNTHERVYFYSQNGNPFFFFKGGPKALNKAIRQFAAIRADKREIILLPAPAEPLIHAKKKIEYDWCLHVPMGLRFVVNSELDDTRATLTIYVPEPLPPALANPQQARKWIADLDSKVFRVRERATKRLTDLGPSVAGLLRKSLKEERRSLEAKVRMEKILAPMSEVIRLDVLEFPDNVPVIGMDTLLARCRKELSNKDPVIRGHAATHLVGFGVPAKEVLPDLKRVFKTEQHPSPLAGAAWAACRLGAAGKPLLPALKANVNSEDKNVASRCKRAINIIAKTKQKPQTKSDARRWATIRREIREFVSGRKNKSKK